MGEVGGWRFFTILLFSYKQDCLQESESFHLEFVKFSITCELWIGGLAPCTSVQPSRRGRDEPNESESFVIISGFDC